MVNFANPQLLYLLIPVALLGLLYIGMRRSRRKRMARFGNPAILQGLMPDVSKYLPNVKIIVSLLALVCMVVMLARPRTHGSATEEEMQGIEVIVAVDVSNSMLASSTDNPRDISRLNRAKQVLNALLGKLNNDRVGLIVFAGDAFTQLPLTPDFVSAKLYLNELSTSMVDNQGTSIGAAIDVAMNSFSGAKDVERAIVVITDAEDQIGDAAQMAKAANEAGIEVDVIGLGSGKGAQIPLDNSYSNWLKDENGLPVTTYLNEALAKEIADAGGGIYINGASGSALNELVNQLDQIKKANLGKVTYTAEDEEFPLFAFMALLLVIVDCIFSNRKIGFLRKYNFFTQQKKALSLVLLLGGTLVASAQPLMPYAKPIEDTSVRKERNLIHEGNKQFGQGHYSEAEILYRRALNLNPASEIALFNQALAQMHLGADQAEANAEQMANALQTMQTLMTEAQNREVAEWAAYSLGNAAFNQKQLQQALEMYKQALRKNPTNQLARENLRFVQKQLQNQDQNQNQQDQNQDQNQDQQQQEQKQDQQQQQQQQQPQNQDQNQDKQQQQQNMNNQNREQILNAVERKDAATRARASQQNGKGQQGSQRQRGKNW